MMNQQEFNEYIKKHIKDYLPDTYKDAVVNIEHISKNNDIVLDAVVIRQEEVNISPTIYLNDLYKSRTEYANELVRDLFLTAASLAGGAAGQVIIPIPVLGYMIGSFAGSVAGTFIYNAGTNATLTFCSDTGFTMFGLVDQDYVLPEDVIKDIGIEVFDYDTFEIESFEPDSFGVETFSFDTFETESIGIKYLRRGVIGVSKIGYMD